jgi:hypothetical protein
MNLLCLIGFHNKWFYSNQCDPPERICVHCKRIQYLSTTLVNNSPLYVLSNKEDWKWRDKKKINVEKAECLNGNQALIIKKAKK